MISAIEALGTDEVCKRVAALACQLKIAKDLHIDYVCRACCDTPQIAPDLNKGKTRNLLTPEQCLIVWVERFLHGYQSRITCSKSKLPNTVPDEAVGIIIEARASNLSKEEVNQIIFGHRLAMSAENILGLLLEEFLFEKLSSVGWAMAWGETIRAVDFCNKDGKLLQIKNRSNSENSSSSKIRDGKPIEKWFRVNAATGRYEWDKLATKIGCRVAGLDEASFQAFIKRTLQSNPNALAIEPDNPWLKA
ncbi:SinI family restriction endonuclease [Victivallales bacterium CCUG 44730]|nr:SinI family restriction endonuclease [Victivallales bacterium CCUG 44730]